jgi:hypothetical protein
MEWTTKSKKDLEQFQAYKAWKDSINQKEAIKADKESFLRGKSPILFPNLVLMDHEIKRKDILDVANDTQ